MSEKKVGDLSESCIPYLSSSLSKNDEIFSKSNEEQIFDTHNKIINNDTIMIIRERS